MNNFNSVFLAIKKCCAENGAIHGTGIFEEIAKEAEIPVTRLIFVLNTLQELQLIKYSADEPYIKLTGFGKKQERLFTDSRD